MSRYQYNIGDYVEYIGDVNGFENVAGKVHRVDSLNNGCYFDFEGQEFYFLPSEVQLTDPPVDPALQEALADAWDEGYTACRTRPSIDGYRINRTNPYRSNK